jgi:hypothetical protein
MYLLYPIKSGIIDRIRSPGYYCSCLIKHIIHRDILCAMDKQYTIVKVFQKVRYIFIKNLEVFLRKYQLHLTCNRDRNTYELSLYVCAIFR